MHENFTNINRRWLAKNSGQEACIRVLQKLRNLSPDHPYLREEVDGIFRQLESEREFEVRGILYNITCIARMVVAGGLDRHDGYRPTRAHWPRGGC